MQKLAKSVSSQMRNEIDLNAAKASEQNVITKLSRQINGIIQQAKSSTMYITYNEHTIL